MRIAVIGALIATGVGAFAVAGAAGGGATFGSALATSFTSPAAFGATLKAGLFGATGAAGTTAGLFGAGGVGATAIAGPAVGGGSITTALGGTPLALGSASSVTTATGFNLTGGALFGGGSITTPVLPGAAKATATTTMGKIGGFVKDAVKTGFKQVAVAGVVNKLTGDREEEEYYRSGSGRATSFSTNARKMVDVGQYVERYSSSSASDFSAIYGTMLNNLSYGNGSLDYAQNTQTALMSGVQVSPLQYT